MTPFATLDDVRERAAEAVIAQTGLRHSGLKAQLRDVLSGKGEGALVHEPVLEAAHPFVPAGVTLSEVPPDVLVPDFVRILDGLPADDEYRFPSTRTPFLHQYRAWRTLADQDRTRSVLVTSGTGSGKTECFLFPILSDLTAQALTSQLEGVQAIMLYPLNALIESQRLRLSAWTAPLGGKVRYCLYNRDLEEQQPASVHRRNPEQVADRTALRASPPPVLVTNVTMLEYMLARGKDQSIIEKSRGKLKWIVLDEAHSYIGAAAAEIALLLRRVLLAFDVKPGDVRFVATSATIGSGSDVVDKLKSFLAEIGGIRDDQVEVILGERSLPQPARLAAEDQTDVRTLDDHTLFNVLSSDSGIWDFVSNRISKTPQPLSAFAPLGQRFNLSAEEMATQLSRARRIVPDGQSEYLAPLRIHAFERALPGMWSCVNPECRDRDVRWPFGRLIFEKSDTCPACQAPVLEVIACAECGTPMLDAVEDTGDGKLSSPMRQVFRDEFADEAERDRDDEEEGGEDEIAAEDATKQGMRIRYALPANLAAGALPLYLERQTWTVRDRGGDGCITLRSTRYPDDNSCPCCGERGKTPLLRPLRFGAPFMVPNAAPLLLEGVAPRLNGVGLPFRGRGLLSFTDSRQGTARLSAKMQSEAERNFVRSFIYHSVQQSMSISATTTADVAVWEDQLAALRSVPANPTIQSIIEDLEKKVGCSSSANTAGISWEKVVDRLASREEVEAWIKDVWGPRDEVDYSDSGKLANLLVLRELDRRPKRGNSLETLGLARLCFPILETGQIPSAFARHGKSKQDWSDYLHAVVTYFLRANRIIDISRNDQHWIMPGYNLRSLVAGDGPARDKKFQRWPRMSSIGGNFAVPVALLVRGLDLDLTDASHRDDVDECLIASWNQLQRVLSDNPERRGLDFHKANIAPVTKAFICPVTNRLLDLAPFGLTPYGRWERDREKLRVTAVDMPRHPAPVLGMIDTDDADVRIRSWMQNDPAILRLREGGQWNNISDRIARFAQYARSAEHSAQQNSARLRLYEEDFKAGRINILNCSTTMEMGVDIGSVSTVMMTNVPPHIANYRQRVGRAGRRGQSLALAFTFCKDRPLDREAFREPLRFLTRDVAAPKVALSSRPIIQRHVNAYLLRAFIKHMGGDTLRMEIGAFMGCPAGASEPRLRREERPVASFKEWLRLPGTRSQHLDALATLVRRSVLEGETRLIDDTADAIADIETQFVSEWAGLRATMGSGESGADKRQSVELKRLCAEFLLSALSDLGFLPGHGFPTSVVTFLPAKIKNERSDDGSRHMRDLGPQRSLDLAIRDYAPGSEVVLDGLVHRSAGITLNWKRPASEEKLAEVQSLKTHWRCDSCGSAGSDKTWPHGCEACGSTNLELTEYIRPAGFTVDPRDKPHAETDLITYVPPEDPEVSTRNAPWIALPWPDTGRQRFSREGRVFYANKGPTRKGYALCLHCGRAEKETGDSDETPLLRHKPLRWAKSEDANICEGNDNPWKIRRNLALGFEITTDVFELQLVKPISSAAAYALVIALREGLARRLGVEADEMGISVRTMPGPYGTDATSLLLFDKASGGAGFAIQLDSELSAAMREAEHILDCSAGCRNGCATCVLTSDAPDGENSLDRRAALAYVRACLDANLTLPAEDQITPDAALSLSTLNEIGLALSRASGPVLLVYMPNGADVAELSTWTAAADLADWSMRGYAVRLVVTKAWLSTLDGAARMKLRDFVQTRRLLLATGASPATGAAIAIAAVQTSLGCQIWASRSSSAANPGSSWGRAGDAPVVRSPFSEVPSIEAVNLDSLLPRPDTKLLTIDVEPGIMLQVWGKRMAERLLLLLSDCGATDGHPTTITYTDPYVRSPLVVKLLVDTVAALAPGGTLRLTTSEPDKARPPSMIWNDWESGNEAGPVIAAYSRRKGLSLDLTFAQVPHGRYMEIEYASGARARLIFDQGFGAWNVKRGIECRFSGGLSAERQAEALEHAQAPITRNSAGMTYIVGSRYQDVRA